MNYDKLYKIRHSCEHVLMEAMEELYPNIKKAIGPATDDGFYFDFDLDEKVSEADFEKIEKKMQEIINKDHELVEVEVSSNQAKEMFKDNKYKLELINELESNGERLSIYYTGDPEAADTFFDLCKGPHTKKTSDIKAFKLLSIAGAYWKGNEKNKMLTRIYGTAFESKKDIDKHLHMLEEAKKRDHRKIGKELDLFTFSDLVGKGLVMYTPKGTIIKNEIKNALLEICKDFGAKEVNIPHMAKLELYEISGHAEKFEEELFRVQSHYKEEFVLKPVNCPHHTQIYASKQRSYKDLPISYVESTQQHRDEKPGAIGGLNRTRSFEIDDGHSFCTVEQIKSESIKLVKVIEKFYTTFGMWGEHWVSISIRDKKQPNKYIGEESDWEKSEKMLQEISDELKLDGKVMPGEAALYGPKLDFMLKDVFGKDIQLGTVQIDFAMPKRFQLSYTDQKGKERTPVMIHRALIGSYGRFIANLLENTKGALPPWLSPVQVKIIPVSDKFNEYSSKISDMLNQAEVRTEIDTDSETLNNKIRKAQNMKVPYMIILGEKEVNQKSISVRTRNGEQLNGLNLQDFTNRLKENIINKNHDLSI